MRSGALFSTKPLKAGGSVLIPCEKLAVRSSRGKSISSSTNGAVKVDKRCPTCGTVKGAEEFHRNRSQADGLARQCKGCTKRQRESYYRRNRLACIRRATEWALKQTAEMRRRYNRNTYAQNPEFYRAKTRRNALALKPHYLRAHNHGEPLELTRQRLLARRSRKLLLTLSLGQVLRK